MICDSTQSNKAMSKEKKKRKRKENGERKRKRNKEKAVQTLGNKSGPNIAKF